MIPALLVWGMRHGSFDEASTPVEIDTIARNTGYTREQVAAMLTVIERTLVKATENESTHNLGSHGR
jgi:hypothetical protein